MTGNHRRALATVAAFQEFMCNTALRLAPQSKLL